jgi:hypothetical protein
MDQQFYRSSPKSSSTSNFLQMHMAKLFCVNCGCSNNVNQEIAMHSWAHEVSNNKPTDHIMHVMYYQADTGIYHTWEYVAAPPDEIGIWKKSNAVDFFIRSHFKFVVPLGFEKVMILLYFNELPVLDNLLQSLGLTETVKSPTTTTKLRPNKETQSIKVTARKKYHCMGPDHFRDLFIVISWLYRLIHNVCKTVWLY